MVLSKVLFFYVDYLSRNLSFKNVHVVLVIFIKMRQHNILVQRHLGEEEDELEKSLLIFKMSM